MRSIIYLKAVVIVHGKSEKQICEFIRQQLRLKMEIESDKGGKKAIQITSVDKILNNKKFKTQSKFLKTFEDIELDRKGKHISPDFKIFIIMDTDDCTDKQKEDFISKKMFENHWAYSYIVPIFNSPRLEDVLTKAKVPFKKEGVKKKEEYIKLFPTDEKYKSNDIVQIDELSKKLAKINETNMEVFFDFCLEKSK